MGQDGRHRHGWDRCVEGPSGCACAAWRRSLFVRRDGEGIAALIERLAPLDPATVAVEATGGFETMVAAGLASAGLPVVVVNPAQVRAFANALGKRVKTDPIGATVIAHFVAATKPAVRSLPDEATQLPADLVSRRRQIVAMIGAERQRGKRAPARIARSIQRLVKALEKSSPASIATSP